MFSTALVRSCGMTIMGGMSSYCSWIAMLNPWKLARMEWYPSQTYSFTSLQMSDGTIMPSLPLDTRRMPRMILMARSPCSLIFCMFSFRSATMSLISSRSSSGSLFALSSMISIRSFSSLSDILLKLMTKFRGFCISWAIPALSSPREASFSCFLS